MFSIPTGLLYDIFNDFYANLINTKVIFSVFENITLTEMHSVQYVLDEHIIDYNDDHIKDYLCNLHVIGEEPVKYYLYESLYCKLYTDYVFFILELVKYLKKHNKENNEDEDGKLRFEKCVEFLLSKIDNRDIKEDIEYINKCRIARNVVIHNNSCITEKMNSDDKKKIAEVIDICDELDPFRFIEITEGELSALCDILTELFYELKEYFKVNNSLM